MDKQLTINEDKKSICVNIRYSAVTYMAINRFTTYTSSAPSGRMKRKIVGANWSAPHGREYHRGTRGGSRYHRHAMARSDKTVNPMTNLVTVAMTQFDFMRFQASDDGFG